MSHGEPRVARRSASQGALNSSYAVSTRASPAISDSDHHLVPYFKPLRSIREHGHTFLDPAASADGMLRKTTETGNIGLFSINTGRHTALRPRASLGDLRQPHRPFSRSSARTPGLDDRKRLPSYRDSTSEIISMYGSDNQSSSKSVSGTLSPPWDDAGQRSYSMTTCGSKSYTLPRNNNVLQAHCTQAGAQRPRSPYPYPTRLPRPGIRPSSPALTENGIVDYSKMVEIDRIPQRTVHHPHKTLFPYKTTREQPGPLSMRYGVNQSTCSLSGDRSPARTVPPTARRPPLPNHIHPWGLRPRERLGSGSSEQSLRTMSLSSASGGYGCGPLQKPRLQVLKKAPPIFYDYSEDFEDVVDPPPDFPIANPTPTRISQSFRPGIPDDGCDATSDSADEGVGLVVDYLRRVTMIESTEDQDRQDEGSGLEGYRPVSQLYQRGSPVQDPPHEPVEPPLPSSPMSLRLSHVVDSSYATIATLDGHRDAGNDCQTNEPDHVTSLLNNVLVSEASTVGSPLESKSPGLDTTLPLAEVICYDDQDPMVPDEHKISDGLNKIGSPDQTIEPRLKLTKAAPSMVPRQDLASCASATLPYRCNSGRKDSRFFSLSSGLSDLASFVKYVDKHIQALDSDDAEQYDTPVAGSRSEPGSDQGRHYHQTAQETHAPPRTSSLAHQRKSYGRRKFNMPAAFDELEQYQVVSTRSGPTLVPQPISPVKMLRVKNSIPQLMKALPPLPGYSPASESPFNPTIVPVEFEPFEFSRLTDARSTLIEPFGSEAHGEEAPEGYDHFAFDRGVRKPKLKLKNAACLAPGNIRHLGPETLAQDNTTLSEHLQRRPSTTGNYSIAPRKRRLPIRLSRPALGSVASDDNGTIKRRPGFNKSSTVSEIASSPPVDLFSTSTNLEMVVQDARPHPPERSFASGRGVGTVLIPVINTPPMARTQRVIVIDEGRGVSLDAHLDAQPSPRAKTEATTEDEMHSFFSDSFVRPRRGLRKKISNLRSRLTDSRHHQSPPALDPVVYEDNGNEGIPSGVEADVPNTFRDLFTGTSPTKGHHSVPPTSTVRSKWEKLVKGAKYRLRTLGKKRQK